MVNNNYLKIAFAGTSHIATRVLHHLITNGYKIQFVLTKPDSISGRGKQLLPSPVKILAAENNIQVLQPYSFKQDTNVIEKIKNFNLDMLIVISYGLILPQQLLDIPKYGCVNIHVSLLPKYRGAAPIQRAIIDGEQKSGVTLIKMDAGLDTGDILLQREININPNETSADLENHLTILGNDMIVQYLNSYQQIIPIKQSSTDVTYANKIDKHEARINWNESSHIILRKIKGFNPAPGCSTVLENKNIKIWNAVIIDGVCDNQCGTIIDICSLGVLVCCGNKTILAITEIQESGKNKLSYDKYILGHPNLKNKVFV